LRHAHLQSVLASQAPRRRQWLRRGSTMEASARYLELDGGDGARLAARLSPALEAPGRSLCVLIHGWEGSHESVYLYSMACALHAAGHAVLRLNLRDHGDSQHLNEDIFHSARIEEIVRAIADAQTKAEAGLPLFVIGFSLGGSFALRTALRGPALGLQPRLCIGVSPVMDGHAALRAIDQGPALYRVFFMDRWRRSMRAKAAAWPERWRFPSLPAGSIVAATKHFAEAHLPFASVDDYYAAYRITPQALIESPVPVAVIAAQDDPIIPFSGFAGLAERGSVVAFDAPARGGHCGFFEDLRLQPWTERRITGLIDAALAQP